MCMIDCSSPDEARLSIAKMLRVDSMSLRTLLSQIASDGPIGDPGSYVAKRVYAVVQAPAFPVTALWFHATRVRNPDGFKRRGLLPKSQMYQPLYAFLQELAVGIESTGTYPNNASVAAKAKINDEGPFAFLCKAAAVKAPGATGRYWNAPEMVEDIAGSLIRGNFDILVQRFQQATVPCVVCFTAPADEYAMESALHYLYLIERGESDEDAAELAGTCYDGRGRAIAANQIVAVEVMA